MMRSTPGVRFELKGHNATIGGTLSATETVETQETQTSAVSRAGLCGDFRRLGSPGFEVGIIVRNNFRMT